MVTSFVFLQNQQADKDHLNTFFDNLRATFLTPLEFSTEIGVGWKESTEDGEHFLVVVMIGEAQTMNMVSVARDEAG